MGTHGGVVSRSNARASRKVQPKNGDRGERAEGRGQGDPFRQDDRIYRMEDPGDGILLMGGFHLDAIIVELLTGHL